MNDDMEWVRPFDSFSAVYKILGWAGLYWLNKPTSGYKRLYHRIYRPLAFIIAAIYNVQHIIFIVQNRHNQMKWMDSVMIEIPHFNLLTKIVTVYSQTSRLDKLNIFLRDDPIFYATEEEDQLILQKNKKDMHKLSRFMMTNLSVAAFFWPSSYIVRRYSDPSEVVPVYVPFATDTWPTFLLSIFIESGPLLWIGYGHISLDVLVSTYYGHAQAQMQIIKRQLEHLVGREEQSCHTKYRDLDNGAIGKRFIEIVTRYEKIVWYKNEIDTIFNFAMTFQFFSSTAAVCLVIYRMTIVNVVSYQFIFLVLFFVTVLLQVFIYCYYGNLLEFESRSVSTALYKTDWLSLSPRFRRQLLIAMIRWSQPLQPRVSLIIPLSLNTFITILKSSYTLYTVLVTAGVNGASS